MSRYWASKPKFKKTEPVLIEPSCKIFIGNLDLDITEEDLYDIFSPYGSIVRVFTSHQHFGFVVYSSILEAARAIRKLNGKKFKNRVIDMHYAYPGERREKPEINERKGKLYLSFLPFDATNEDIDTLFSPYGTILDVNIFHSYKGPFLCGYLTYKSKASALAAAKHLNRMKIGDHKLVVKLNIENKLDKKDTSKRECPKTQVLKEEDEENEQQEQEKEEETRNEKKEETRNKKQEEARKEKQEQDDETRKQQEEIKRKDYSESERVEADEKFVQKYGLNMTESTAAEECSTQEQQEPRSRQDMIRELQEKLQKCYSKGIPLCLKCLQEGHTSKDCKEQIIDD